MLTERKISYSNKKLGNTLKGFKRVMQQNSLELFESESLKMLKMDKWFSHTH